MLCTWRWTAGRWTACGLLLAATVVFAQTSNPPSSEAPAAPPKPQHKLQHKKSKKAEKPVVLPAMPGGPLRQLPMDQIPATPAKVTYEGGLLTISAQNSPMGEILRDVRKLTGASIDIPPHASAADERVITHIGPGTPRDVLVTLLNGSSFNYVMLGSDTDPAVVSNIILTSKTPPGGEPPTAVANSNPAPGAVMPPRPVGAPQAFNPQGQQQQSVQHGPRLRQRQPHSQRHTEQEYQHQIHSHLVRAAKQEMSFQNVVDHVSVDFDSGIVDPRKRRGPQIADSRGGRAHQHNFSTECSRHKFVIHNVRNGDVRICVHVSFVIYHHSPDRIGMDD